MRPDVALLGDPKSGLAELAELIKQHQTGSAKTAAEESRAAAEARVKQTNERYWAFARNNWDATPIAGPRLMHELKQKFTIAIVTHNMQQAARVADKTGFLYVDTTQGGRTGYLVEFDETERIFNDPKEKHTRDYITGAFS